MTITSGLKDSAVAITSAEVTAHPATLKWLRVSEAARSWQSNGLASARKTLARAPDAGNIRTTQGRLCRTRTSSRPFCWNQEIRGAGARPMEPSPLAWSELHATGGAHESSASYL